MARRGETIANPATGERIEFRATASDTDGEAVRFDYYLEPGGFATGKRAHVHPRQEERLSVESGALGVRIDGDEWTATPGTKFSVLPGTAHTVWNAGDTEMHAVVELRPALDAEAFFETTFGLARDGKTTKNGNPGLLQFAVLADAFGDKFRFAAVPAPLQRALATALAPAGRLAGYRSRYPRYGESPASSRPDARTDGDGRR
ncbi:MULTISPECIES: cupin domain-containing protein [Halorussus]|uniref:cupin domain-containing protein n=1 Tax=Halorussus TaxID=1070314 RepID=UPI00209E3C91|nr:cupin domain-containing protein [Halorussus vallis]USZ77635.1 cupin domain-containing protein [Halorussus vallis]